jgi:hypothetical protein
MKEKVDIFGVTEKSRQERAVEAWREEKARLDALRDIEEDEDLGEPKEDIR